jgi:hypothetical protein
MTIHRAILLITRYTVQWVPLTILMTRYDWVLLTILTPQYDWVLLTILEALSWWDQRKMHNVFSSLSIFALYMLDSDCRPASNWRPTLKSMSDLYITDMYLKSRSLTIQNFYHDTYRDILDKGRYVSRYVLWHFVYLCVRCHFLS